MTIPTTPSNHSVPNSPLAPPPDPVRPGRGRWMLLVIALVCLLPLLAALYLRFVAPPTIGQLAGEVLTPTPFPFAAVTRLNGSVLTHPDVTSRWMIVHTSGGQCAPECQNSLYLTRQARTAQGRNMERIERVWILTDATPPAPELLALHPDLVVLRALDPAALRTYDPQQNPSDIHLVDRRGFVVFRYAASTDPKTFIKELGKLVKF